MELKDSSDFKNLDVKLSLFLSNTNSSQILLKYLKDPINYGLMAVANGDADGLVGGATISTSEIIRRSIRIIGVDNNSSYVSSIFFMISKDNKQYYTYSDCGVIPEPDVNQLVDIAYNAFDLIILKLH